MKLAVAIAAIPVALVLAGCSTTTTSDTGGDTSDTGAIADEVRSGFGDKGNVIVHDVTCDQTTDADHFACQVSYETAEGLSDTATVRVTCDPDRCVWRQQ